MQTLERTLVVLCPNCGTVIPSSSFAVHLFTDAWESQFPQGYSQASRLEALAGILKSICASLTEAEKHCPLCQGQPELVDEQ